MLKWGRGALHNQCEGKYQPKDQTASSTSVFWQERLFQEPKDNVCSMSNLIVVRTESERVDTNMSNMHIDNMIIIYT